MFRGRCGREIAQMRRLAAVVTAIFLRFGGQPQKSLAASVFFLRLAKRKKPCDFCSGMVASPLAATVVTAMLRSDFCAAKARNRAKTKKWRFRNPGHLNNARPKEVA